MADATKQGQAQASSAAKSVGKLGLTGTVIYYDMEGYANSCRKAVIAFLGGWVTGLHSKGFRAGAYGSAINVAPDFVQISPPPDDVWIASVKQHPNRTKYDNVTVWGINGPGYNLPDTAFANSQRIRQYSQGHDETWGGGLPQEIDADIEDVDVAGGGGTKTYSFNDEKDFQPGPSGTMFAFAFGINDGVDGVLVPGMSGMVVGNYIDANANGGHGHGYVYNPNDGSFPFPTFDCAGAKNTVLLAINNAGTAVGFSFGEAAGGTLYAFSFDTISGGGCQNLPCSNCVARGINDAGWIVGSLGLQAFVYKPNGTTIPFGYPGSQETIISGIDGQGRIAGSYSPDMMNFYVFTGDASTDVITFGPALSCPPNDDVYTNTGGTNSNGQVTGSADGGGFFWDVNSGCVLLSAGLAFGLNDAAQIVGLVSSPNSNNEDFVLSPPH